ncbi:hypothetical protein QUB00_24845 [Microcoleus sp. F8_C2]
MSFFTQTLVNRQLYLAKHNNGDRGDRGFLVFVLPDNVPLKPEELKELELDSALHETNLSGSFVFSAINPRLDNDIERQKAFVKAVNDIVKILGKGSRAFLWLTDPLNITKATTRLMNIASDGKSVSAQFSAPLTSTLNLEVQKGIKLTLLQNSKGVLQLQLGDSSNPSSWIKFSGSSHDDATDVSTATLDFSGSLLGCIQFNIFLHPNFLHNKLKWGFQFLFPLHEGKVLLWLPLANIDKDSKSKDRIGFHVSIDPSDVFNDVSDTCTRDTGNASDAYAFRRTFLAFADNKLQPKPVVLASYYRTIFGVPLNLLPVLSCGTSSANLESIPARFVFVRGSGQEGDYITPEGDFSLHLDGNAPGETDYYLLCGLQGTEFFSFQPGDYLRFISRQPAYAANFPFSPASPVGPPVDLDAPLLDKTYMTAWATIVPRSSGKINYVAQPKGGALYGQDGLIHAQCKSLLGSMTPGYSLSQSSTLAFPLLPYAGVKPGDGKKYFSKEQIESYESQVIAKVRRRAIASATKVIAPSAKASLNALQATDSPFNVTTPSGLITTISASKSKDYTWSKILLGQNQYPKLCQMYFAQPDAELQEAFQTNQLFLVAANAQHLGKLASNGSPSGQAFYNLMNVEDWVFEAQVGQNKAYGDYSNVLIVKGCKGKLYDSKTPKDSLIANPQKWTQAKDFAAPTTIKNITEVNPPDQNQLVIVSQWLCQYFQDASKQTETEYFQKFNALAQDENWTGILILKMQITSIPNDLVGLKAGMTHPQALNVHHFGIEINQVKNDLNGSEIELQGSSSMFGLIYYADPGYDPNKPEQPVPPAAGTIYDFQLLTLKILFQNTQIQKFRCYAQLTLNELFGMPVSRMGKGGNPYNTIVLRGSYQKNGSQGVYSLNSIGDSTFYFNSNVINKVEVISAHMSALDSGIRDKQVFGFNLSGFIDYQIVHKKVVEKTLLFDIFSFGSANPYPDDSIGKGLNYKNLGIQMTLSTDGEKNKNLLNLLPKK